MKLSTEDNSNLQALLATCAVGGIEVLVISEGTARGINEAHTFVMFTDYKVPKLEKNLCITRVAALKQRLDLLGADPKLSIVAEESPRSDISQLLISAGRNKVQFRCAAHRQVKARVNDVTAFSINVSRDELKLITSTIRVMGTSTVQLIISANRVASLSCPDSVNDVFSTELELAVIEHEPAPHGTVVHHYSADTFTSVIRSCDMTNDTINLSIGLSGSLSSTINGHNVYILPKINNDYED